MKKKRIILWIDLSVGVVKFPRLQLWIKVYRGCWDCWTIGQSTISNNNLKP